MARHSLAADGRSTPWNRDDEADGMTSEAREVPSQSGHQPGSWRRRLDWSANLFRKGQELHPFRLLREDMSNLRIRYVSDWTVFNQLVVASTVYVFFTNLLPGITFAGDLYVLTGQAWGTIEVVFSTGLCGVIFAL
jgi:hypothetical protein